MGTKYSSQSISGYNSAPPSDDGAVSENNKVKWSTIKSKITDPVKTLAEAINTALATHFNRGPTTVSTATTLGATHYNQIIEASGTSEITLTDATTLTAGWFCDIINSGVGTIPIQRATASDTIDGTSADTNIVSGESIRVVVNNAATGFLFSRNIPPDGTVDADIIADGSVTAAKTTGMQNVVQIVNTQTGTAATGTTTIPEDTSIPQNDEGDEYMTLAITPTDSSNILIIEVIAQIAHGAGGWRLLCLFQDSTADALCVSRTYNGNNGGGDEIRLKYYMVAGTTSETTFKIRAGSHASGTTSFNTNNYGNKALSSITITEYKA